MLIRRSLDAGNRWVQLVKNMMWTNSYQSLKWIWIPWENKHTDIVGLGWGNTKYRVICLMLQRPVFEMMKERRFIQVPATWKDGGLLPQRASQHFSASSGFYREREGKQNKEISRRRVERSLLVSQHSPFCWLSWNWSSRGLVFMVESQQASWYWNIQLLSSASSPKANSWNSYTNRLLIHGLYVR